MLVKDNSHQFQAQKNQGERTGEASAQNAKFSFVIYTYQFARASLTIASLISEMELKMNVDA